MTGSPPTSLSSAGPSASSARPALAVRERVVDLLQLRFADDCLSLDEFERRVAVAYQAKTVGDLDALVADLAPASVPSTGVPTRGRIVTVLSNNERNGAMPVPQHLDIVSILGNVEFDMSNATFELGVTDIVISAVFGNVQITVPFGIRVESGGNALFGNFDYKTTNIVGYARDTERLIRITGHAVFSSVEISTAPPRPLHRPDDAPRRLT